MQFEQLKRREFITLLGGAAASWPIAAGAQQRKIATIGILLTGNPDPEDFLHGFRAALPTVGLIEGQNIRLDVRSAEGSDALLPGKAAELVRLNVDVIVASLTPAVQAARHATDGAIKGDYPVPTTFTSKIVSNAESSDVTMVLEEGNVKELAVTPPPSLDLVPVTKANRQGIADPLTALLFSAAAAGEGLSQEACRRTLPIFDGHQRYDLKLAFKRMDKMTAEKGYAGPVVVCSVNYEPIAGHRANIPLVKYLSEGREIEIALAPIAGTRLLAPFRLSVVSTLANLMIGGQSIRNDYGACAGGHAPYHASSRHFINAERWRHRTMHQGT